MYIWVTRLVYYLKQELLFRRKHMSSLPVFFVGSVLLIFLLFVLSYCVSLRSGFHVVMPVTISAWNRCAVRICLKLFVGDPCLVCVICVCLRVMVSSAYCVVCLLCFSSSFVPYVASFSWLFICDCLLTLFPDVYFNS